MDWSIIIVATALLGVAAVSRRLTGTPLTPAMVLVAVGLTLVRIVPVAAAMVGSGARPRTVAFLGWFGPRGLAATGFAGSPASSGPPTDRGG